MRGYDILSFNVWILFLSADITFTRDIVFLNESVSWYVAKDICHNKLDGYLLSDVPPTSWYTNECIGKHLKGNITRWLGIATTYTPYIAHKGCFSIANSSHMFHMEIPSVGACFKICSSLNIYTFGIMNKTSCLCIGNFTTVKDVSYTSCTEVCNTLFIRGEYCGGQGHSNLYELLEGSSDKFDENKICKFISCTDGRLQAHLPGNCQERKGRICSDRAYPSPNTEDGKIEHTFKESRELCSGYMQPSIDLRDCANLQAVEYWVDTKQYEYQISDSLGLKEMAFFRCLAYSNGDDKNVQMCDQQYQALCLTDSKFTDMYPTCPFIELETGEKTSAILRSLDKSKTNLKKDDAAGNNSVLYGVSAAGAVAVLAVGIVVFVVQYRRRHQHKDTSKIDPSIIMNQVNAGNHSSKRNNVPDSYQNETIDPPLEQFYAEEKDGGYDELNGKRQRMNSTPEGGNAYSSVQRHSDVCNVYNSGNSGDEGFYSKTRQDVVAIASFNEYGICGVATGKDDSEYDGIYPRSERNDMDMILSGDYYVCSMSKGNADIDGYGETDGLRICQKDESEYDHM